MDRGNPRELWEYVLNASRAFHIPANFNTWFQDSSIVKIDEGIVYVGVPSQFFKDWYLKKFTRYSLRSPRRLL